MQISWNVTTRSVFFFGRVGKFAKNDYYLRHLMFRVSVRHSIIHKELANKMQQCNKICYSTFIWSSTCFGRHTAHHQELKTALAASGFAYVKDCWTLWLLDAVRLSLTASSNHNVQHPFTYAKPDVTSAVLSSWWWAVCRSKHAEL